MSHPDTPPAREVVLIRDVVQTTFKRDDPPALKGNGRHSVMPTVSGNRMWMPVESRPPKREEPEKGLKGLTQAPQQRENP
ncbi:hypothetical protein [Agromyces marinus]|uniref:Uncharacterized protein n=1 Tax=Agromyces marinus TaxID=1389020 RepID=A0ABM8GX34_9MICO|nr:hypothetical protein [Agromyces marinus]BDZ53065.1 hypothetical protein GCM10025870_01380 [Agromyces marinus]